MKSLRNPLLSLPASITAGLITAYLFGPAAMPYLLLILLLPVVAWHLLVWLPVLVRWSCRQRFSLRALMIATMLIAFYLGGVKSGGVWQDLISDHLQRQAALSDQTLFILDVYGVQQFSTGDVVDVEGRRGREDEPPVVGRGATLIRVFPSPGRSRVMVALDRDQALKLRAVGTTGRYVLVEPGLRE